VPVPGRPSIRRALFSQGLTASVNARTPPEAADGTTFSATPTSCVATSIKKAVQAGGISFLLSGHTAASPTGLPSPTWSCFAIASCPSTVAAPEWLKMPLKLMLSSPLQALPSNPSIEGMPKRLRLLCTPHVKR
jgi:hypothetical protein